MGHALKFLPSPWHCKGGFLYPLLVEEVGEGGCSNLDNQVKEHREWSYVSVSSLQLLLVVSVWRGRDHSTGEWCVEQFHIYIRKEGVLVHALAVDLGGGGGGSAVGGVIQHGDGWGSL